MQPKAMRPRSAKIKNPAELHCRSSGSYVFVIVLTGGGAIGPNLTIGPPPFCVLACVFF